MDKLEKVINGLECCIKHNPDDKTRCGECPYDGACLNRLKSDALALLKAQEARVISWQDAESMRLCWVETRFPHTISPADIMHYFAESPNITVFKIHQNAIDWPIDEYGIKWRCWTNEPTNAQREATPWN